MNIVLASRNKKKISEMRDILRDSSQLLGDINVLSLDDIGFYDDIVESGSSFLENARIKAQAGVSRGYITVADDSGLSVDALGGAPGIFSARYSGAGATDELNNQKLLRELADVEEDKRGAKFVCAICCLFPDGREISVERSCKGIILFKPRGSDGFGYDPLFYVPEFGRSFAELSKEEKNSISHRGLALREFARIFADETKGKDYNA